jgi:hypothetical protein
MVPAGSAFQRSDRDGAMVREPEMTPRQAGCRSRPERVAITVNPFWISMLPTDAPRGAALGHYEPCNRAIPARAALLFMYPGTGSATHFSDPDSGRRSRRKPGAAAQA